MSDLSAIQNALDFLIPHKDYAQLKRAVEVMVDVPEGVFAGELSILNPLVEVGREKGVARLKRVWDLSDAKRNAIAPRKRLYQAGYMKARRAREAKAIKVWEMVRGTRMTPEQKTQFRKAIHVEWSAKRDDLLDSFEGSGGDKNALVAEFWSDIDDALTTALAGDSVASSYVLGSLYDKESSLEL